jgi:ribosomal protein L20A (L18A)
MKFLIEGTAGRKNPRQFKIEIEAKSEKHARELALIKLGATNGVRKEQIDIIKLEVSKGK